MNQQHETDVLKSFLRLEKEIRASKDMRHLSFVISNHSKRIFSYTQSAVWRKTLTGYTFTSISATSSINYKSPYVVWMQKILIPWLVKEYKDHVSIVQKDKVPSKYLDEWSSYLTDHVIYCPFRNFKGDEVEGGVLYINSDPWSEEKLALVEEMRLMFEHSWQLMMQPQKEKVVKKFLSKKKRKTILFGTLVLILALFVIPVRQTVLAPGEIAPKDPLLISSSIEGIIQTIDVKPNDHVKKGQVLFSLDKITLKNKFEQAQKAMSVAQEQYRRAYQDAYNNPESKAELAILKAEMEKAANDLAYSKSLLQRSDITAAQNGIVIFSSPKYWLGRPIEVGEQVMLLAPEDNKQLEIEVPQADMIQIKPGDKVRFFPNIDPLGAINAKVDYASFVATPKETGELTYYVAANFNTNKNLPRYGAHGTAKIYGHYVSLFFYLFKRPLIFIQSWLGI